MPAGFVIVSEDTEHKPRSWIGEVVRVEGEFVWVRYGKPSIPERLRRLGLVVKVRREDTCPIEKERINALFRGN